MPSIRATLEAVIPPLLENRYSVTPEVIHPTYKDDDYDLVVFTDASAAGWGAIAKDRAGLIRTFQERWVTRLHANGSTDTAGAVAPFYARHSAHAEPQAALRFLSYFPGTFPGVYRRIDLVTDHYPIPLAQRAETGYRGIGRGYALNSPYAYTNDLFYERDMRVVYFYIAGPSNPADSLSRNFGADTQEGVIEVRTAQDMGLPSLHQTSCPIVLGDGEGEHWLWGCTPANRVPFG